jgi:hypothetical protein
MHSLREGVRVKELRDPVLVSRIWCIDRHVGTSASSQVWVAVNNLWDRVNDSVFLVVAGSARDQFERVGIR